MYPPMLTADVPKPAAFFPLTEGYGTTVTSFPDMEYNGTLQGSMPCVSLFFTLSAKLAQISQCDQSRIGTEPETACSNSKSMPLVAGVFADPA